MKQLTYLAIILFCLGFSSCGDDCQDAETTFQFTANSQLVRMDNTDLGLFQYEISEGDKFVFRLSHAGAQCNDTFDDEWGERIVFEVDQEASSFRFVDSELIEAQCYYSQWGAWVNSSPLLITSGSVEGTKLSESTWSINLSLNLSAQNALGSSLVEYEGTYVME